MFIYLFIFIISVLLYFQSQSTRDKDKELQIFAITMVVLALFVGLSDMLGGYDRYIYAELFDDAANVVSKKQNYGNITLFTQYAKENGYDWYNVLVAHITENRYIFIFITTIVIYILLFNAIKQYCNNYPFAIILFLGLWFFFTFTYLRQVMGATIAWLSVKYIIERKAWKFFLVWFIAYKFHNSALIFLPMYFVPIRKFDTKIIIRVMVACLILGLTPIPTAVFGAYGEVDANRLNDYGNESGFRIAYLIEAVFFLYLIITKYIEIPNKPLNIVMLNMSLVFCALLLFFVKSENGGRLSWFYMIGVISTITYLSTHTVKNRNMANMMIVVCFFLFFRIVNAWGIQLYPYKTFLTNGIRKGDIIEEIYEYDHAYDNNKFYRAPFRIPK